jgi:hypothetical protein
MRIWVAYFIYQTFPPFVVDVKVNHSHLNFNNISLKYESPTSLDFIHKRILLLLPHQVKHGSGSPVVESMEHSRSNNELMLQGLDIIVSSLKILKI